MTTDQKMRTRTCARCELETASSMWDVIDECPACAGTGRVSWSNKTCEVCGSGEYQDGSLVHKDGCSRSTTDQPLTGGASDQARFAAHEFVARWYRESGEQVSTVVTDRMLLAYEMGYLRGHGEGLRASMGLHDEVWKKVNMEENDE